MPSKMRKTIERIYKPHPIKPETIFLETEDDCELKPGMMRLRALDGFVFVKNGEFVYPTHDKTPGWWKGVEAYGYASALTGDYRWFIWAGRWDEKYGGKHIEVVHIKKLQRLQKEKNRHWRGGQAIQTKLADETFRANIYYALLEPEAQYDCGHWTDVIKSWIELPDGQNQSNPGFTPIKPNGERPDWWVKAGDKAWNHMIRAHRAREREAEASQAVTTGYAARPSSRGKKGPTAKPGFSSKRKATSDAREKRKTKVPRHEGQLDSATNPPISICSSGPNSAIPDETLSSPPELAEQSLAGSPSHASNLGKSPTQGSWNSKGLQGSIESGRRTWQDIIQRSLISSPPPSNDAYLHDNPPSVVSKSMLPIQDSAAADTTASPQHLVNMQSKKSIRSVPGSSANKANSNVVNSNSDESQGHSVIKFDNAKLFPLDERCSTHGLVP
ncbi:hypothetical protein CTheo_8822 [Ceratobasidium theobromae]|uniref:Uncharacterized protein n=1 Tax=Ceratobasidium theobromae TaxID=1582974 RepID=A0A5N5Q8J5_9AGAM|nr:hypothetical protein CTheo_8822 [Ceratobasidium theobromae]